MKAILKPLLMVAAMAMGISSVATLPAQATLELNVNKGNVEPMPIAIPDFEGGLGPQISEIVTADLKRSGLFAPIDKAAFVEKITNPDATPRFDDWKVINAQALVTGSVSKEADGRIRA
ncbi:Tol-Pal system protein TolB, partial [Mesorhizobium sp. M2C.T.Ca.TU.002.02.1.1]